METLSLYFVASLFVSLLAGVISGLMMGQVARERRTEKNLDLIQAVADLTLPQATGWFLAWVIVLLLVVILLPDPVLATASLGVVFLLVQIATYLIAHIVVVVVVAGTMRD